MFYKTQVFRTLIILLSVVLFSISFSYGQKNIEIKFEKDETTRAYTFYSINNSFATYTVELKFSLLDNLEPSKKTEMIWQVPPGKTQLLVLTPIENKASTNFKYKKKSRKGCSEVNVKKDINYTLPIKVENITQAIEYADQSVDNKTQPLDWYAIGIDASVGVEIRATKSGTVVEIVEIKEVTSTGETGQSIRKYLEIEHDDCTFGKYEVQLRSAFSVKAGDIIKTGQSIGIIQNKSDRIYNDLVFSVHYLTYEEVIRNGEYAGKNYYKAYIPLDFNSKLWEQKLAEGIGEKPAQTIRFGVAGEKYNEEEYRAKKKAERKEK